MTRFAPHLTLAALALACTKRIDTGQGSSVGVGWGLAPPNPSGPNGLTPQLTVTAHVDGWPTFETPDAGPGRVVGDGAPEAPGDVDVFFNRRRRSGIGAPLDAG